MKRLGRFNDEVCDILYLSIPIQVLLDDDCTLREHETRRTFVNIVHQGLLLLF